MACIILSHPDMTFQILTTVRRSAHDGVDMQAVRTSAARASCSATSPWTATARSMAGLCMWPLTWWPTRH